MINRTFFLCAAAFICSASAASAQGQQRKQVVVPKTVLKSLVAHKPKTKTQLGAKAGIVTRKGASVAKRPDAIPTAVRQVPIRN